MDKEDRRQIRNGTILILIGLILGGSWWAGLLSWIWTKVLTPGWTQILKPALALVWSVAGYPVPLILVVLGVGAGWTIRWWQTKTSPPLAPASVPTDPSAQVPAQMNGDAPSETHAGPKPEHVRRYRLMVCEDVLWTWKWNWTSRKRWEPAELVAYCPKCGLQLRPSKHEAELGETLLFCEKCNQSLLHMARTWEELTDYIRREIDRQVLMNEWQDSVNIAEEHAGDEEEPRQDSGPQVSQEDSEDADEYRDTV